MGSIWTKSANLSQFPALAGDIKTDVLISVAEYLRRIPLFDSFSAIVSFRVHSFAADIKAFL